MAVRNVYLIARKSIITNDISLSVRVRLYDVLEYLSKFQKIKLNIYNTIEEIEDILVDGSIIFFNKTESLKSLESIRARFRVKIVYDLDDFIPNWPSYSNYGGYSDYNFSDYINLSDVVLVPSDRFRENIIESNGNSEKIQIFQSSINYNKYLNYKSKYYNKNANTILYTNADSTKLTSSKNEFISALKGMIEKYPIKLKSIGDDDLGISHKSHQHIDRLSFHDYFSELSSHDYLFAIIPLGYDEMNNDDIFNDCKSPVKYWHYSLAKIPGIYSKSVVYIDVIKHGINGFLCQNNERDWFEKMEILYKNSELRNSIAENAFVDVILNHHIKKSSVQLMEIIEC